VLSPALSALGLRHNPEVKEHPSFASSCRLHIQFQPLLQQGARLLIVALELRHGTQAKECRGNTSAIAGCLADPQRFRMQAVSRAKITL
jgi:hypothetical protein